MQVAVARRCDRAELTAALSEYFGGAGVSVFPCWEDAEHTPDVADVLAVARYSFGPFPVVVDVFPDPRDPAAVDPEQARLARFLSGRFGCRTATDAGRTGGPAARPRWVFWDHGSPCPADAGVRAA